MLAPPIACGGDSPVGSASEVTSEGASAGSSGSSGDGSSGAEDTSTSGGGSSSSASSTSSTSSSSTASTSSSTTDDSGGSDASSGGSSGDPPACPGGDLGPGDHTLQLPFGGASRSYILHVPPGYGGDQPTPLILNFHGLSSNAGQQGFFSLMNEGADA
ncbi:MAG: hypothetical protein KC420_20525, partial [Myxococcales bacterium]|nr:hypothetical protein [Myxococcales bacterium]